MKVVMYVVANANHLSIMRPIAGEMERRGYIARFLSLDEYYCQGAFPSSLKNSDEYLSLSGSICNGRWYDRWDLRSSFVLEAAVEVEKILAYVRPAAIVFGHDTEGVEQLLLRAAERYGIRTTRIQDGAHHVEQIFDSPQFQEKIHPFDGGAELLLTWSEKIAAELSLRRVSGTVQAVGNPRYDILSDWPGYNKRVPPYKVLVVAQCLALHGQMLPAAEVAVYERLVRQILSRGDTRVRFKLHPQQRELESYRKFADLFGELCEVIESGDTLTLLRDSDLLVTIASTVAIESEFMRIPTARLFHLTDPVFASYIQGENRWLSALQNEAFPCNVWIDSSSEREKLFDRVSVFDSSAAKQAAEAIDRLIVSGESITPKAASPKISVLINAIDGDLWGSVRSVLRTSGSLLEVIIVDSSTDAWVSSALPPDLSDGRVRIIHSAGASTGRALNLGISAARAEFVARIGNNCIALHHWAEELANALTAAPGAEISVSWYFIRDPLGLLWKMHATQAKTPDEFVKTDTIALSMQAYAFRKARAGVVAENDPNAEVELFFRLIGNPQEAEKIVVVEKLLFLCPFDPSTYRMHGPKAAKEISLKEDSLTISLILEDLAESDITFAPVPATQENISAEVLYRTGEQDAASTTSAAEVRTIASADDRRVDFRNRALAEAQGSTLVIVRSGFYVSAIEIDPLLRSIPDDVAYFGRPVSSDVVRRSLLTQALIHFDTKKLDSSRPGNEYPFYFMARGGFAVGRKNLLTKAGFFDDRFETDWALDVLSAYRLWKNGVRIVYEPSLEFSATKIVTLPDMLKIKAAEFAELASIAKQFPEMVSVFFGLSAFQSTDISGWFSSIQEDSIHVPQIIAELSQLEADFSQDPSQESLVSAVSDVLGVFFDFLKHRAIVRQFLNLPHFAEVETSSLII